MAHPTRNLGWLASICRSRLGFEPTAQMTGQRLAYLLFVTCDDMRTSRVHVVYM